MTYRVEVTNCDDSCADALIRIEPPVKFQSEEARITFGLTVRALIMRRTGAEDIAGGKVEITHDLPDDTASIGYAQLPALKFGSGRDILEDALHLALNGE